MSKSRKQKPEFLINQSRRHFLKGVGGTFIAIPFLPSYSTLLGQEAPSEQPMRFISFGMQNGYHPAHYWPALDSNAFSAINAYTKKAPLPVNISTILGEKFNNLRQYLLMTENIDYLCPATDHGTSHLLTAVNQAVNAIPAADMRYSSIDHYIADHIYGTHIPHLRALNLNLWWYYTGDGQSLSYKVNSDGSYSGPARTWSTSVAWERLFGSLPTDAANAARERTNSLSVTDAVLQSYKSFQNHPYFSTEDKKALASHLEQLNSLEKRIKQSQLRECILPQKQSINYKSGDPNQIFKACEVMVDLIVAGFRCDLTRIVNFDWRPDVLYSGITGINRGHHDLSHSDSPTDINKENTIHMHAFNMIQYLIQRLAEENLIDSTIGFVTNEIGAQSGGSYGTPSSITLDRNHEGYGAQTLIFGSPSKLNTGHILKYDVGPRRSGRWTNVQGAAYNELLITLMAAFGVPPSAYEKPNVVGFGDYRGDRFGLLKPNIISPPERRGKPLPGVLKT